ncbi:MAG: PAS domain-containing protein [Bdellovibrionales bacterium]|nr:PAS domain-containing protein [Bdellovibrionales bacterium]
MGRTQVQPTGKERFFGEDELIVSKTDLRGRITYANNIFCRLAGYEERELLGQPHSIIRHPDMPRSVFKLLWDTIESKQEIFAFVVNLCKNGDHYWVFAHVTPSFDDAGNIIGYHSNRRVPDRSVIQTIEPLYAMLRKIEAGESDKRRGMEKAYQKLVSILAEKNVSYDEFIFSTLQM